MESPDKKLYLRAGIKLLTAFALLWLLYIMGAGFLSGPDKQAAVYRFKLSELPDSDAFYLQTQAGKPGARQLLVIKTQAKPHIFWAHDPVYGCLIEYKKDYLQPVCINIKYDLQGKRLQGNETLQRPDHEIIDGMLLVYP